MKKREFNFETEQEVKNFMADHNGSYIIKRTAHGKKTEYHSYDKPILDMYDMLEQGYFGNDDTQLFTYQEAKEQAKQAKMDGDDKFYEQLIDGILQYEEQLKKGIIEPDYIIYVCGVIFVDDKTCMNFWDDIYFHEIGVEYNED